MVASTYQAQASDPASVPLVPTVPSVPASQRHPRSVMPDSTGFIGFLGFLEIRLQNFAIVLGLLNL